MGAPTAPPPAAARERDLTGRARAALPLLTGLLAAAVTFAVLAPLTDEDEPAPAPAAESAATGRAVFARMGCGNCHTLAAANASGQIGPDLDQRLPAHNRQSLKAKILEPYPNAPPGEFLVMPRDFGERMTAAELDALVAYLLSAWPPPS